MKTFYIDDTGHKRESGEIWYDRSGNECYFRDNGRINVKTINDEPSMTVQSEADKLDLNIIKAIYDKTGIMNNVRTDQPRYGDFTSSCELHDVLLRAQEAQEDFMLLDARIRSRFDNDPGKLIDFVMNPKNEAEAISLGLLNPSVTSPQADQVPQGDATNPF